MDDEEQIRQLQGENDQLKREIEPFKGHIAYLEARLAQYEDAHITPNKKRSGNRKKNHNEGHKGKPDQRVGHKGLARPTAKPDTEVQVTKDLCSVCGSIAL